MDLRQRKRRFFSTLFESLREVGTGQPLILPRLESAAPGHRQSFRQEVPSNPGHQVSIYSSNFGIPQEEKSMKIVKTVLAVLTLALFGSLFASGVHADQWDKKTTLTFSQPVEIPGQILPAGTYMFKITVSPSDRHIVQIYNADGSQLITTVLAINDWRIKPTGDTVVKFAERSGDNPEAVKAWFYPGDNFGQEFVYPRARALELAAASKEPIPAMDADTMPADLTAAPIVAVTPEQKEVPVAEAIAVNQPAMQDPAPATQDSTPLVAQTMPKTASMVPLIALLGLGSIGFAFFIKRFAIHES
jgi:hypothetical protein